MFKFIDARLGNTRTRTTSIHHLDARLLADIGLTHEDFRRPAKKKTA